MPTLLDGAMGTELSRRGYAPLGAAGATLERPQLVRAIHRDYVDAGASVLVTNTFGLDATGGWPGCSRSGTGGPDLAELCGRAVDLSRSAGATRIAGAIGPANPAAPEPDQRAHYHALGTALRQAGADVLFSETHTRAAQARCAHDVLAPLGLPLWIAVSCDPSGRMLGGDDPAALRLPAATLVLVGCTEFRALLPALDRLRPHHASLGVRPSLATTERGSFEAAGASTDAVVEAVVEANRRFGLAAVGGCCGTTPTLIRRLGDALRA